jgi:hypothetical protein
MLRNHAVLRKKSFWTVENDRERVAAFRNVAELADALHSKSRDQKIVWVWAPLPAAHPCFPTCRPQNGNHSQNWTHHLFFMTNPARAISASVPERTRIIESVKPDSKAGFGSDLIDFRRRGAAARASKN